MQLAFLADGTIGAPALSFLASTEHKVAVAWGPSDPGFRDWVSQLCSAKGIPFEPMSERDGLEPWLEAVQPDLGITFGCPWKLSQAILAFPRLGWINLHGGPLPAYRGPQPVFWQIRNGERESALVAHRMDEGLDTGPILATQPIPLALETTFGTLTQTMAQAAPVLLQRLLQALDSAGIAFLERARPQGGGPTWPRPGPDDIRIDWATMDASQVLALVRACNPWNSGAWTALQGQPCRLVEATLLEAFPQAGPPGSVQLTEDQGLTIACRDGRALRLDILRLEEGFFTGSRLRAMGIGLGACFT